MWKSIFEWLLFTALTGLLPVLANALGLSLDESVKIIPSLLVARGELLYASLPLLARALNDSYHLGSGVMRMLVIFACVISLIASTFYLSSLNLQVSNVGVDISYYIYAIAVGLSFISTIRRSYVFHRDSNTSISWFKYDSSWLPNWTGYRARSTESTEGEDSTGR